MENSNKLNEFIQDYSNKQWLVLSEKLIKVEGVKLDPKKIIQRPIIKADPRDRGTYVWGD